MAHVSEKAKWHSGSKAVVLGIFSFPLHLQCLRKCYGKNTKKWLRLGKNSTDHILIIFGGVVISGRWKIFFSKNTFKLWETHSTTFYFFYKSANPTFEENEITVSGQNVNLLWANHLHQLWSITVICIKKLLPSHCGKTAVALFDRYTTLHHFSDTQNMLDHRNSNAVWRDKFRLQPNLS